ncbi:MAG: DUF2273 domain-containing protein [Bacillota bacterium]
MDKEKIFELLIRNHGKFIGVTVGLSFGVLVITIGLIKTLFLSLCIYIGYSIGNKIDRKEDVLAILDKILPPGNFRS